MLTILQWNVSAQGFFLYDRQTYPDQDQLTCSTAANETATKIETFRAETPGQKFKVWEQRNAASENEVFVIDVYYCTGIVRFCGCTEETQFSNKIIHSD